MENYIYFKNGKAQGLTHEKVVERKLKVGVVERQTINATVGIEEGEKVEVDQDLVSEINNPNSPVKLSDVIMSKGKAKLR